MKGVSGVESGFQELLGVVRICKEFSGVITYQELTVSDRGCQELLVVSGVVRMCWELSGADKKCQKVSGDTMGCQGLSGVGRSW